MAQDFDKDLYIVLVGTGKTTPKNFADNVEDYIFGDRDEREAEILMPYTKDLSPSLGTIMNEWAVGNYPIHAYVEEGHRSVADAVTSSMAEGPGVTMSSLAIETAMTDLVERQKAGNEVVVVVVYDEEDDVKLVGELKNYQSIPVLNVNGMIDDFPGFKTTDEILEEERKREEFETKEAIRIAAEKEQEKAEKAASAPAKKAAAPRKRAQAKPTEEKPLTEATPRKTAAPRKKAVAPKPEPEPVVEEIKAENPWNGVNRGFADQVAKEGSVVEEKSELPQELEPVKALPAPVVDETPDLWKDVSQAQAGLTTHYSVKKENLVALGEGIKAMSEAHAKTIDALLNIIEGK